MLTSALRKKWCTKMKSNTGFWNHPYLSIRQWSSSYKEIRIFWGPNSPSFVTWMILFKPIWNCWFVCCWELLIALYNLVFLLSKLGGKGPLFRCDYWIQSDGVFADVQINRYSFMILNYIHITCSSQFWNAESWNAFFFFCNFWGGDKPYPSSMLIVF